MLRKLIVFVACGVTLAGCATGQPQAAADFTAALDVAAVAEFTYAAGPSADPKVVSEMSRLLGAAQAALFSWTNTHSVGSDAAVSAAIAALVAYEAASRPA